MAHGVKINGTNYGISGGKVMVNGTNYEISKGRTLVGGTGYDIAFAPDMYTFSLKSQTIPVSANSWYWLYAGSTQIVNTERSPNTPYGTVVEFAPGTQFKLVIGTGDYSATLKMLDGRTTHSSGENTFSFTPTGSFSLSSSGSYDITLTFTYD